MAYLNPNEAFEHLQKRVLEGIQEQFVKYPITGKKQSLHLEKLEVDDKLQADDLRGQHKAKVENETWAVPVYATVALKHNDTGEVIDRRRIRIAEIPKTTRRHSYIIDGQEYQVDNQWQLRPGVYTRRRANGEIESVFNGGKRFDVVLDPASKVLRMEYSGSRGQLPIYPLMKTLGVSDEELTKTWGKEVLDANRNARNASTALEKFYKADKPWATEIPTHEAAAEHFYNAMEKFHLRPESTQLTLGKPFTHVTGDALRLATEKMLKVQAGHPEDDRDSLVFKDLRTAGDYAKDAIRSAGVNIKVRASRQIDKAKDVWDVLKFDMFNKPIKGALSSANAAARTATQINPLEMISSAQQTTVMGSGGIKKVQSVTDAAKFVNPSHLGFLDPLNTPEGEKTGITLRLPMGVRKVGNEAKIPLYNLLSKKTELLSPGEFMEANIVLPDQVRWEGDVPHPIHKLVRTSSKGNEIRDVPFDEAHYVMHHPSQLFNMTSNLIPFLGSTSGNRASMASRHMEQAVSLLHREAPLVQVDGPNSVMTFEKLMGQQASHESPVDGKVTEVKKDAIILHDHAGVRHEVQIYNNYPLNEAKGVMHSTPLVAVGDSVKKGKVIADTNFTKDGTLALGTNLRVAYLPFKGYNFEDGIVISDSAAEKLSSEHLQKLSLPLDNEIVLDKKRFHQAHPGMVAKPQYDKLGADGVIRVGQKVQPGDPLIVAMKPFKLKDRTGLAAIRRSMSGEHTDKSLRWDSDFEGEVVGVHRTPKGLSVHVRTVEPMQVGDKLSNRFAAKGIVTMILPNKEMPHTPDGKHIEVAMNPSGVPGRMNPGQLLEAAAGKIAQKTGKTYVVKNFGANENAIAKVQADLHAHGLSDTESLKDPGTGQELGQVLVGPQHLFKLVHQVEKKLSVRSGSGSTPGAGSSEGYDLNLQPLGGKSTGGQSIGTLGLFALLAHGAKCFLGSTEIRVRGAKKRNLISDIVRNRKKVEVLSYNTVTRALEWQPVVAWQARVASPGELIAISYAAVTAKGRKKGFITKVTGGHEFYTADGKVQAGDLQVGASLLTPGLALHPLQRQLILGSILGDASLSKSDTQSSYFRVTHGAPQEAYCRWKHAALKGLVVGEVSKVSKSRGSFSSGPKFRFWTQSNGELTDLREQFYPYGKKVVPLTLLAEMTELALAVWFMDDGDTALHPRYNYRTVRLATCDFSLRDIKTIRLWMRTRWGLRSNISWKRGKQTGKLYPYITFFNEEANKLLQLVAPFVHESMRYKLRLDVPGNAVPVSIVGTGLAQLDGVAAVPSLESVRVLSVKPYVPKHYESFLVYNIEVEGNHNYVANGVLVGNSNIREMQSYKSEGQDSQTDPAKRWPSDHHKIWAAIQTGQPLPTPKPTFAFRKFEDMIRGTGVNIDKKGHDLVLSPMTNDQILTLAKHALPRPADLLQAKVDKNGEHKPKPGGLWDEKLTGGLGGRQWTRIELAEPIPNPIFETPIRVLTGLSSPKDYAAIINGTKGVSANGNLTDPSAGITGGAGIELLLKRIDVKRDLAKAETQLKTVKGGQSVDKALKKVKYLRALDQLNMKPHEAYILHNVPVIPPIMRPTSTLPDGTAKFDDLNQLYSDFAKINDKLKDPILARNLTDEGKAELRESYYDGVKAFMGLGMDYKLAPHKGLLHKITGSSPKTSYFQDKLISRRQDLTLRSTIVPEPALDLDEVGLPKHAALELFKPFVVRKLKEMGAIPDEMAGAAYIEKKNTSVWKALDKVMAERPVLLKRDPALHKYNVQAFRARTTDGNAVRIHPLVTGGFGADFDGDTMSAYVPITREAVAEARKMMPSQNLFSEATGKLMYQPTLDSALGLYKLSTVGKDSHKTFEHAGAVLDAVKSGHVGYTDVVHIGGKQTTAGRILLASALPEGMQHETLHNLSSRINRNGLDTMLTGIAKNYAPQYGEIINKLKDLGNGASFGAPMVQHATSAGHSLAFTSHDGASVATQNTKKNIFIPIGAHSLSLKDFTPDIALREHILAPVHKSVAELYANPKLQKSEQDRRAIALYEGAADEMKIQHEKKQDKDPSNLFTMYRAGVKPGWDQYKQMVLAPMIYKDSSGEKIPTPVTKSYAEGLDIGSYWTQMHGARRGSVMKVQETSGPGYLSKLLMSNMMHILVNSPDCGTNKGVLLDVNEPDIHDRYLQQGFTHGKLHIAAGTLLSPDIVGQIRAARKDAKLLVRSPLKCEDEKGICQKCAGYGSSGQHYDLGHNIGVQSAQAVGERGIQLALRAFHTGGVGESKGGSKLLNSFERFNQLMELHKTIPYEASLAMKSGKIEKITPTATGVDVYIGGHRHHVGRDVNGMALHHSLPGAEAVEGYMQWKAPAVGVHFDAGEHLSDPNRSILNPHRLYEATGSIEKVQNHLTNEVYDLYKDEGIKRRAIETVVRAMSNLTQIKDPGDHPDVLRGEFRPMSTVYRMNQELLRDKKRPIEHTPTIKGVHAMPLALQEDWMAKLQHERLQQTFLEAAATAGVSHIHGSHPIPAIAYGAELGLTVKDSLRPGYEHLKSVPAHHY